MKYQLIKGEDFNYYVYKNRVEKIIFTDEKAPKRAQLKIVQNRVQLNKVQLTDLSNDRNGSVVGWMEANGIYKVSTQTKGQKVIFNKDCSKMFYGGRFWCDNIELSKRSESEMKEVYFDNVDTSNVTDMSGMFACCRNLKKLDLSNFDTSNVRNMCSMFSINPNLEKINLHNFNTSSVEYMVNMFNGCASLTNIDVSHFDTHNVTNMIGMFEDCKKFKTIGLESF